MDVLRLVVLGVLGSLFAVAAIGNAIILVCWVWRRSRASMVPFVGGLAGLFAMLIAGHGRWCWMPLVLDAGTGLMVIGLVSMCCTRGRQG